MADVKTINKTINDVNNDTVINTTTSVDEEQILQFILPYLYLILLHFHSRLSMALMKT